MGKRIVETEVLVVGAGTAGAHVAAEMAAQGRRVTLLERRRLDQGGAHWFNGVLDRHFDRAGIARPSGLERIAEPAPMQMRTLNGGPDGVLALTVRDNPVVGVDMARLGRRLRRRALDQGVTAHDEISRIKTIERGGRLVGLDTQKGDQQTRYIADLVIDASGRSGVVRSQSSLARPWCPPIRGGDLCSAADTVFRVTDPDAALAQLQRWGSQPGHPVDFFGVSGGFSTRVITVGADLREVRVLVGCIADGHHSTGPRLLAETRRLYPWIGEPLHGGASVIPLRRPFARFTGPGLALVGDAASQVFAAHGSGVGMGLLAGTVLAEVLQGAQDPGDEYATWTYQRAFMNEFGADLIFFDGFRRLSVALGADGVTDLLSQGVMSESLAQAGLDQRRAKPTSGDALRALRGLAAMPGKAGLLAGGLLRCEAASRLGPRLPEEPDPSAIKRWNRRIDRLVRSV